MDWKWGGGGDIELWDYARPSRMFNLLGSFCTAATISWNSICIYDNKTRQFLFYLKGAENTQCFKTHLTKQFNHVSQRPIRRLFGGLESIFTKRTSSCLPQAGGREHTVFQNTLNKQFNQRPIRHFFWLVRKHIYSKLWNNLRKRKY